MFSKLIRVSNLFPQSARDAMSLEVADRSLYYDTISRGGASSLESLGQHYSTSCNEVATLSKAITKNGGFSSHGPPSPGAPAGDHHRHPSRSERKKSGRNNRNLARGEASLHTTKSNTTTAETVNFQTSSPTTEGGRRAKRHSAPSSAENAQRKPGSSTTKVRTGSAKPDERHTVLLGGGNGSRHGSPHVKNHRPNTKQATSPSNKSKLINRKSNNGNIRQNDLYVESGVKALSSSELIIARRSARDSQRQMRQKAKLAIAMWKERMTKKRESSLPRLATCNGCFPPVNMTEEMARELSAGRRGDESDRRSPSRTRQPVPRHDCQMNMPASPRQHSPRKMFTQQQLSPQQQQRPDSCKLSKRAVTVMGDDDDVMVISPVLRSPILSPEMMLEVDEDRRIEVAESPIPRSSPDDLSATDVSTKAASSSQHSTQLLTVSAGNKRNSASSRENQRSKIPRPVDGQGDKVKKNDSAETTSILSSSSEKEVTSQENLMAMLPEDMLMPSLSPQMAMSPTSPLLSIQSVLSVSVGENAQELTLVQQQPLQLQQSLLAAQRVIVEPLREKRRRRGGHRLLHSTDDDEDDWPDSPSTVGSPPIVPSRSKPRARHHTRRSPKPVASASPSLLAGKRSSGGDADTAEAEGMLCERGSPIGFCSGPDSDAQSSAVIVPRRKPYINRKMVEIKLGGMTNEMRDHLIRKRQRQEIYALNQVMTALEFAQFEHFCRTRNIPLSV